MVNRITRQYGGPRSMYAADVSDAVFECHTQPPPLEPKPAVWNENEQEEFLATIVADDQFRRAVVAALEGKKC